MTRFYTMCNVMTILSPAFWVLLCVDDNKKIFCGNQHPVVMLTFFDNFLAVNVLKNAIKSVWL